MFVVLLAFNIVAIHAFISSLYSTLITPDNRITRFIVIMMAWETILLLSSTILFYRLLITHIRARERNRELLEILLVTFTHKLGNFISSQVINLNIISERYNDKAIDRMLIEHQTLKEDMNQIVRIMESFKTGTLMNEEKIDIRVLIDKVLYSMKEQLKNRNIKIYITKRKCHVLCMPSEMEIVIYLLIDNAIKYSDNTIHIRISNINRRVILVIRNDISSKEIRGTGMGLKIVDKLCKRYRIKLKTKERKENFTVLLTMGAGRMISP